MSASRIGRNSAPRAAARRVTSAHVSNATIPSVATARSRSPESSRPPRARAAGDRRRAPGARAASASAPRLPSRRRPSRGRRPRRAAPRRALARRHPTSCAARARSPRCDELRVRARVDVDHQVPVHLAEAHHHERASRVFSTSFVAVPAFRRVLPGSTSGPVTTRIETSASSRDLLARHAGEEHRRRAAPRAPRPARRARRASSRRR